MYNILLDRLPDNYKGYLIRTDFRIGIQIYCCLKNKDLFDSEKTSTAYDLLYGKSIPKSDIAYEGLVWFLNIGEIPENKPNSTKYNTKEIIDFEIDSSRIYSGFKKIFDIDIKKEKMHWFEFRYLMMELNDCHLSDIIEIRNTYTKGMDISKKRELENLKEKYDINGQFETEKYNEQKRIFEIMRKKRGV